MAGLHLARAWIIAALLVAAALFSHAPAQSGTAIVLINEFMPAPGSGREWAELINIGDVPADVGGWRIDDDLPGNSGQALIPAGTVIPPGGLFVIEWNTNFLNNTGDTIQLIDPAGDTLDAYTYGSASIDLSLARQPDGAPVWVWGPPSRGSFNAPLPDPPTATPIGTGDTPAPTATVPAPDDATGTPTAT
ncbi:MAG: lamin tail domain-containing protein, partial [Chloroflexaceae bacterium]